MAPPGVNARGGARRVQDRHSKGAMLPVRLSSVSEVQPRLVLRCGEFMWPRRMMLATGPADRIGRKMMPCDR